MSERNDGMTPLKICIFCDWLFCVFLLGGAGYAVFWLDRSGWWFVAAVFVAGCWSCKSYRSPEQIKASADAEIRKKAAGLG